MNTNRRRCEAFGCEAFERAVSSPGSAAYAVAMALLQEAVNQSIEAAYQKGREKARHVSVGNCKQDRHNQSQ